MQFSALPARYVRPWLVAVFAAETQADFRVCTHWTSVRLQAGETTLHSSSAFAVQKFSAPGYLSPGGSEEQATRPPTRARTTSPFRTNIRPPNPTNLR